ncbi:MATE efflux family protein [Thalassoporum mexicanum PCC 7367]|uniref:MATE family efflux transporter n=1 Tax=Thalassoporum mexicanum TaxID=3457544 RepID=UPI00029FAFDB|nr:MATE family efflux transporter [Pseudanabaena sp. PCC 7367]AFY70171.1 MATE efflux family protein [Pseudanabaena sp. PCC 7367]
MSKWTLSGDRYEFLPQFLRLAIINIISNLMVPLAGLIDSAFLGHLDQIRHLAGVSLATVLFNYIYWSFGFLRMGTTGTTAQALGRGDRAEILLTLIRNGLLATAIGMAILLLQLPLRELGFQFFQASAAVENSGREYFNATIWAAPAFLINYVLVGWFLGQSQSIKVLLLSIVGSGANVLLNYLFVVELQWQSTGAGIATTASQYLTLLLGIGLVQRSLSQFTLPKLTNLRQAVFNPQAIGVTFALNGNIMLRTFALITVFSTFTNLSSALSTTTLAANSLLLQVFTSTAYFIDGFANATESLVGIFKGNGDRRQLVALLQVSAVASFMIGILAACGFIYAPAVLFALLTSHSNVVATISNYVVWLLPILGIGAIAFVLDGYFIGLTAGATLRNAALISAAVGFAPIAYLAWQLGSNHLLWLALAGFMLARAITLAVKIPSSLKTIKSAT